MRELNRNPDLAGNDALAAEALDRAAEARVFGDYELLHEIARGGMGVVFKARQRSLDRIVALKMISAGEFATKEQALRFRVEAEVAARLQHPNIVRIYETGEHVGRPYFSMDYVAGGNLAALVREKPLPAKRAAAYVKTIAEAIHYAHEQGILHRDLKPSNVLIDDADQPRVTDFGLAKRMTKESFLTVTGDVMGSPSFMPPEQAGGKGVKAGRSSDVYGLGAILFYLVSARPPFVAGNVAETLHHVLNSDPVSPRMYNPGVPAELAAVCLKCLAKGPEKRYQTAQEVADELRRFLNDEPILALSPFGVDFSQLHWAKSAYAREYLDDADEIIPVRRYLFSVLASFLQSFRSPGPVRVCDFGCGDGALDQEISRLDGTIDLTLVDGSSEMLEAARQRLGGASQVRFVQATFDAVIRGDVRLGPFEFIVSSFAIHHLNPTERTAFLFRAVRMLVPGGWFLNLDVGLSDDAALTEWHFARWREQVAAQQARVAKSKLPPDLVERVRRDPDNQFSTITSQLNSMRSAGFVEVECLHRDGIFVLYCGRNPLSNPSVPLE